MTFKANITVLATSISLKKRNAIMTAISSIVVHTAGLGSAMLRGLLDPDLYFHSNRLTGS